MKILFLEDVGRHGRAGEVKEVANGYARNYLIPRNLAVPATKDQLQRTDKVRKAGEERRLREEQNLSALAEQLEGTVIALTARAGATGRLYGSVTTHHIAEKLSELAGREIDHRSVLLEAPIRDLGTWDVQVRLHTGIITTITVSVEAEGAPRQVEASPAEESIAEAAPQEGDESTEVPEAEEEPLQEEPGEETT